MVLNKTAKRKGEADNHSLVTCMSLPAAPLSKKSRLVSYVIKAVAMYKIPRKKANRNKRFFKKERKKLSSRKHFTFFHENNGRDIHTHTFLQAAMPILRLLLNNTAQEATTLHRCPLPRITHTKELYKRRNCRDHLFRWRHPLLAQRGATNKDTRHHR